MRNETARRKIESLDYYLQNHSDDYGEESHTAMMMATKALEQEDVLDKIRAEIIDALSPNICSEEYGCLEQLLGIIDKYRGDENV